MQNPYTPPTCQPNSAIIARLAWLPVLVGAGGLSLVLVNYWTATELLVSQADLFMHGLFITLPITAAIHVEHLWRVGLRAPSTGFKRWLVMLALVGIFLTSLSGFYSINPYESFLVNSRFFGSYGWIQWTWLVFACVLPLGNLVSKFRNWRGATAIVSVLALLTHSFNAWVTVFLCHIVD